ncbi:MAG: von Willebrand factor type A domain-containing protein [Planctomycetaceae bacterium]
MSTNHPVDRSADEAAARLTAHGLDQLEGRERDEVAASLIAPDATEPRRIVAETRAIAEALRGARDEDLGRPDAAPRSQDLRRTIVARLAAQPLPSASMQPPRRRRLWGLCAIAGSLAAVVLVAVTLPVLQHKAPQDLVDREPTRQIALAEDAKSPREAPAEEQLLAAASHQPPAATPQAAAAAADAVSVPLSALAKGGRAPAAGFGSRPRIVDEPVVVDRLIAPPPEPVNRERYSRFEANRDRAVADEPLSTFSIDVDTASYANVRRFLAAGSLPPRDAVRIEELVNSFRSDDPVPDGPDPFAVSLEATACPWHKGRLLVRIGIRGRDVERASRPAGNIVFLIDVSGSMQQPDKLPLVKQALGMLVEELTENDRVSIVTYAGNAGLVLPPTTGDQKQTILAAIEGLSAGGSTHGSAGIALAYEQAAEHFIEGGANRVILATDGDLNVGVTSDAALVDLITQKAAGGTFLTVLGFGQGNLQDEKMEKLADNGNGVYAYIDGVREARKVLVEQLTGSTITIAKDVKIQVEFNPALVASYRLVGYENRLLANSDFRNDRKDAGEIGAGHTVTALYEVVPVGTAGADGPDGAEPLKYQKQPAATSKPDAATTLVPSAELLTVKLRFKAPDGDTSTLREYPLADRGAAFDAASADLRFAAAVAAFGMILRGGDHAGCFSLDDVARIAGRALGRDEGGYRAEFLDLVRKAAELQGRRAPTNTP